VAIGVVVMVLMGMLAGLTPAVAAMRLRITDALRRT
jgi:ABC-type antimicrobial peptide transport system permease subunit